jgi:hypothetical protein
MVHKKVIALYLINATFKISVCKRRVFEMKVFFFFFFLTEVFGENTWVLKINVRNIIREMHVVNPTVLFEKFLRGF